MNLHACTKRWHRDPMNVNDFHRKFFCSPYLFYLFSPFLFTLFALFFTAISTSTIATETCVDCHDDVIGSLPVTHSAAEETCNNCHANHPGNAPGTETPNPENPLRLIATGNELCFNCHDKAVAKDHPVFRHPLDTVPDPLYPERTFSCISCHNPHSSKMPAMFRYNYTEGETPYKGVTCAVCHWGYGGTRGPKPVAPSWLTGEK